jgi:hypothetical protein
MYSQTSNVRCRISLCKLISIFILGLTIFGIIAIVCGKVYSDSLVYSPNLYPVKYVQHETYAIVSTPENITLIWWPNQPSEYIVYNETFSPVYEVELDGCLDVCYSFIGYYDPTNKLIRCTTSTDTPIHRTCYYSDTNLLVVTGVCGVIAVLFLIMIPFVIVIYVQMDCVKKSDYMSIQ